MVINGFPNRRHCHRPNRVEGQSNSCDGFDWNECYQGGWDETKDKHVEKVFQIEEFRRFGVIGEKQAGDQFLIDDNAQTAHPKGCSRIYY